MELDRILVAVNPLAGRDAAFERALAIARVSGAELYLLHAVPADRTFSSHAAERLARLDDMRRRAEEAGVGVQIVEQQGDAAGLIQLHASTRDVDLIVLGAEPRRGRWRHRSRVAERVVRRSSIPTLVVAGDADAATAFRNIVVAIDLSPVSADVLQAAVGLSAKSDARITAVHAVEKIEPAPAVPARWFMPGRTRALRDAHRDLESVVAAAAAHPGVRVDTVPGTAPLAILDYANSIGADLVVVAGSRGFRMLGPTALRVLRDNDRSLLVIPNVAPREVPVATAASARGGVASREGRRTWSTGSAFWSPLTTARTWSAPWPLH